MKIRPVGAEFLHADGRTDITELVTFWNYATAPKRRRQIAYVMLKFMFLTRSGTLRLRLLLF
jgi:hypothetical protein